MLKVAEVQINYGNWSGKWQVAVSDEIPAAFLIGWDLIEHVKSAFVLTHSKNGQTSPTAAESDTVAGEGRERESPLNNQINSGAETDFILLKSPNKNKFVQEQKEDFSLGSCFEAARMPTVLSPECPEWSCLDKELLDSKNSVIVFPHIGKSL